MTSCSHTAHCNLCTQCVIQQQQLTSAVTAQRVTAYMQRQHCSHLGLAALSHTKQQQHRCINTYSSSSYKESIVCHMRCCAAYLCSLCVDTTVVRTATSHTAKSTAPRTQKSCHEQQSIGCCRRKNALSGSVISFEKIRVGCV
jgi:hypothetical protein